MKTLIQRWSLAAVLLAAPVSALAGFSISGRQLLDNNGNNFIIRGINHAHTWYPGNTASFADIAATGANTVRVVLATGGQWTRNSGADVANVISLCKANRLICMLEVHGSTGWPESAAAVNISNAAAYWTSSDIMSAIQGQENFVLINIANEPFGNNVAATTYVSNTISAIQTLRNAGLTHTLVVDAANWGQDWQFILRDNATQIFNADTRRNTLFSVHMYEVFNNASAINSYFDAFQTNGLPLIVGEFGADHQGQNVDEDTIFAQAQARGIGYIGWSWSGNGSCCTSLDITINFNPAQLSTWGNRLINGPNGIQ